MAKIAHGSDNDEMSETAMDMELRRTGEVARGGVCHDPRNIARELRKFHGRTYTLGHSGRENLTNRMENKLF